MLNGKKTVLSILPKGQPIAQRALAGIREIATPRHWDLFSVECYRGEDGSARIGRSPRSADTLSSLASMFRPDGLIVWGDALMPDETNDVFGASFPTVFIEGPKTEAKGVCVIGNSASIAEMAARELLLAGFEDFAYIPYIGTEKWYLEKWNLERGREFEKCIAIAGKRFHGSATAPLAHWLSALPRPCGVFAANDIVGEMAIDECAKLGLRVPQDIAVVGVDNMEYICENTSPTLSSVAQDIFGEGREAARLLAEWMGHARRRRRTLRSVPAKQIVRRASSRPVYDDRVARALEEIRLHACEEGFGPPDVVRALCLSRAPAFRLFKRVTGRTILDEIHAIRLTKAQDLLTIGTAPDIVAAECGYSSHGDFRRVFRKRMGETVRNWTLANRKAAK